MKKRNNNKTLVIVVIILLGIVFFARHQNIAMQSAAPAYQNHQDQGFKAF